DPSARPRRRASADRARARGLERHGLRGTGQCGVSRKRGAVRSGWADRVLLDSTDGRHAEGAGRRGHPRLHLEHGRHLSLQPDTLLDTARRTRSAPPAQGRLHPLPLLPGMVAATGLEQPSMDFPLMLRAVETMLGVIAY